jgi:hypothetical protein
MSAGPDPRANAQVIEQERRRLSQRLDEVARLCESGVAPAAFYGELLHRLIESLAAAAGSVWLKTAQGNLQQQYQINMQQVGLDASEEARQSHDALLRMAFTSGESRHVPPRSLTGPPEEGKPTPGNRTGFMLLLVPIKQKDETIGLLEVFQGAGRPTAAIPGFLQYTEMMAALAGRYQRNQLVGQLVGQQQLWTSLEAFARAIHGSLNTTEVAFQIANEGRRLVECDRVSVAIRPGGQKTEIVAVSGADVVEKRSNQVRLMRKLADAVLSWGEKLVFSGTRDDSLPPRVLDALDAYLHESPSKLLVVQPLRDEREAPAEADAKDKPPRPPRSALVMECFESPPEPAQTQARLEIIGRHAASALYNAIEHRRIPLRFLWLPLAKLQEGLGGKTRAIVLAVVVLLSLVGAALYALPYPLKMDSTGRVLPVVRRTAFAPAPGTIISFDIQPNEVIGEGRSLARLYDSTLFEKLNTRMAEREAADRDAEQLERAAEKEPNPTEKAALTGKAALRRADQQAKDREIREMLRRTNAVPNRPGQFNLLAPFLTADEKRMVEEPKWTVLSSNFKSELENREVKPSEPILQLGVKEGPWEVELKIPQKHIGQVLRAFDRLKTDKLEVDFVLQSDTTTKCKGILERSKISGEANPNKDDNNESDPVVIAYVNIEHDDIPAGYRVSRGQLVSGTEVRAKVRCGDHRAGYSLFYGVWEFLYEKVVFYFF